MAWEWPASDGSEDGAGALYGALGANTTTMSRMDRFCGGAGLFGPWGTAEDHSLDPDWGPVIDFSTCFEDIVIASIPTGFLLVLYTLKSLASAGKTSPYRVQSSPLFVAKQIFVFAFAAVCAGELIQRSAAHEHAHQLVAPAIMLFGAALAMAILQIEFRRNSLSVPLLTIFWIMILLADSIRLYTQINLQLHGIHYWEDTVFVVVHIALALVCVVLSSFAEKAEPLSPRECPEERATLLSVITFWWMNSTMVKGYRRPLQGDDLFELNRQDQADLISEKFHRNWRRELESPGKPSMLRAMRRSFGGPFFMAAVFKASQDTLAFVAPQLLKHLMKFVQDPDAPVWHGYFLAAGMLLAALFQSIFLHQYFHRAFATGMRLRSSLTSAVYNKSLRLSMASRQEATTGEIVNLMSTDAQRFNDSTPYLHVLWSGPFQIALSLYFLWDLMEWATLAGVGVMILMIPVNGVIAKWSRALQVKQMKRKDARIKLMNEVLNGIRVIKIYAWERPYREFVRLVRGKELEVLKTGAYLDGIGAFSWTVTPFLVSLVTFIVYAKFIGNLTPEKAFVSLSLFNLLRFPLAVVPFVVTSLVQCSVSLNRIKRFLLLPEFDPDAVTKEELRQGLPVCAIKNGDFAWSSSTSTLSNINFEVHAGQIVAVVGTVGCGKSSLLSAALGDIAKTNGTVMQRGCVAYVPQQAWIQNGTVKDNILFGKAFDEARYKKVLWACALEADLEILEGGDLTEIGEKGINLSGGQKHRISLARAVYQDCDLYLLDDPLSAVDSHVGKHIFKHVIGPEGLLKDKARVLVTHLVHFLPKVDQVYVLQKGVVSETGSYSELVDAQGAFAEFLSEHMTEQQSEQSPEKTHAENSDEPKSPEKKKEAKNDDGKGGLIASETAELGSVKSTVYLAYLRALGWPIVGIMLFLFFASYGFQAGSNFWLAYWSDQALKHEQKTQDRLDVYLGVYAALGIGNAIGMLASTILMALGAIYASKRLHENLLHSVLRSPMAFFDTTPMGRILNRFAQDINVIDQKIPATFRSFARTALQVLSVVAVISYSTPIFLAAVVPLTFFYGFIQRYYVASSRQLKRLASVRRSPIYAHFSETLAGVSSIRAYGRQQPFIEDNQDKVDFYLEAWYPNISSNRWLAVRLEFVGNCIIFFAAMFAVIERHKLSPSIVGLSVSYAMTVTQTLNWMVRMTSDLETDIVAVERVNEYIDLEPEAPLETEHKVSPSWPEQGAVEFQNVAARYRPGLQLVLRGISFNVMPGEKVGIVGRTGAGKSSLTVALFRIIEAAGGQILIDGQDISLLGLEDLRSRLTIMPQDPVLFSGSVRDNLDPFHRYDDATLWNALETSHLKSAIAELEGGLEAEVSEGGSNFSVGQRQLLCLARAVLRKTKILVLDEATAAVDFETDQLIQNTIREEFYGCTILVIAHRLNTIMDSDRVLVLDKGEVAEFDTPAALMANPQSLFHGMAKSAGATLMPATGSSIN
eukprot:m.87350 g.87350  ORF g.87350 m.87350 type:complete len:1483 (+) comp14906_c0_seq3:85-4533(+)